MEKLRGELREGESGEPEVWANLGDILDWLESLPEHTNNRIAASVALEIKEMLLDSVTNAEVVRQQD